jgi:hypothetical protein
VDKEERVAGWIAASALFSSALIQYFVDVEARTAENWAFTVVRDAGLYVGAIAIVVGSLRAIRREAITAARVFQVVVGIAVFGFLIGAPLATQHLLLSSRDAWSRDIDPLHSEKVRRTIDNPLSPIEQRSFASSVLAAEIYAKKGEIVPVISTDGETRPYEPDERARELRQSILKTRSIVDPLLPRLKPLAWFAAVVLLASVAAGLKSPIDEPTT